MTRRWLGYPMLTIALLLAVFTVVHVVFAEQPEDCAPEDREIPGNTNSPCKWDYHFDEITSVRYDVVENAEGNTCHEVLVFSPYVAAWDLTPDAYIHLSMGKKDEKGKIQPVRLRDGMGAGLVGKPGNSINGDSRIPSGREHNKAHHILFSQFQRARKKLLGHLLLPRNPRLDLRRKSLSRRLPRSKNQRI